MKKIWIVLIVLLMSIELQKIAAAPPVLIYSQVANGAVTFTGNTLGLSGTNSNPNADGSRIGAFTSLNPTQVGTYPVGTTLNWQENGSSAVLDLPAGSTVLYAELIWGGCYFDNTTNSGLPVSTLDTPITLTASDSTIHSITPRADTAQEFVLGLGTMYTRSFDVTSILQAAGAGTYSVEGVPAIILGTGPPVKCAGWTLAVAYSNPNMFTSFLNLYIFAQTSDDPSQLVTGFTTPLIEDPHVWFFASCYDGDPTITDSGYIGPGPILTFPADAMSGVNNPINNFWCSQINTLLTTTTDIPTGKLIYDGTSASLDTRGTFGTVNANPFTFSGVVGARQGYDITAINVSDSFTNAQTELYYQLTATGEVTASNAIGLQIRVESPTIEATKEADVDNVLYNQIITYTITLTNTNPAETAETLVLQDSLPDGLVFVENSITVGGAPVPGNIETGISLGDLGPLDSIVITFQARVDEINPPVSYENFGTVDYSFTPLDSVDPVDLMTSTNIVITEASPDGHLILPPENMISSIRKFCFLDREDGYYLKFRWTASPDNDIVLYRVYFGNTIVVEIPAADPLRYSTCVMSEEEANTYSVTAVDSFGNESDPLYVNIETN